MSGLIDRFWDEAEQALGALGDRDRRRLGTALSATDAVWDAIVFDKARSFRGDELREARLASAEILARLLGIDFVALVSAAGGSLPASDDPVLDEQLEQARHDVLNTFSNELLGPVRVGDRMVYGLPIVFEHQLPVGAVLLVASGAISGEQEHLLREYLRHLDTRMTAAEQLFSLRREMAELELAGGRAERPPSGEQPGRSVSGGAAPDGFSATVESMARTVPRLSLFGVELPTIRFGDYCDTLVEVTDRYLTILDEAEGLYLDIPNALDAKAESKASAPYRRLLEMLASLRPAVRLLYRITPGELELQAGQGRVPTFSDLTRIARDRAGDDTVESILDIMNDQGEADEVDAVYARRQPYEFRAANLGEVFAVVAVHRLLMLRMPDRLDEAKPVLSSALIKYQAARAFLFAYENFSEVPLRGEKRYEARNAQTLLFRRRDAPSFSFLLSAYRQT